MQKTTGSGSGSGAPEVSVVLPCLDEVDTLETCITKARNALVENHIDGEIIVADNGSKDGSVQVAERLGVRLVHVERRGYGSALMAGIAAARGRYIVMADADDSYDLTELPRFVAKLREGFALVQGCRLPAGGGTVLPGAMPFLHRWVGTPVLSGLVRRMFDSRVTDINCGMRGFTRELYEQLELRCTGMEFAQEMIVKSSLQRVRIAEIGITLHPDGRVSHGPHLRTFRDGWRHLRLFLLYSPRWLFLIPGVALVLLGLLAYALGLPAVDLGVVRLDVHTLLVGSLCILLGYHAIAFAILAKTFAVTEGLLPADPRLTRFFGVVTLERGLVCGGLAFVVGIGLIARVVLFWQQVDFGALDYTTTMRWVVSGVTLAALGFETVLFGFFAALLTMRRD